MNFNSVFWDFPVYSLESLGLEFQQMVKFPDLHTVSILAYCLVLGKNKLSLWSEDLTEEALVPA